MNAASIAADALRQIGAFPPTQSSANPHELRVAVSALSDLVAHLYGTEEVPWLREYVAVELVADTATYDLAAVTSDASGCDPSIIEHWDRAWLIEETSGVTTQRRTHFPLLYEPEWQARCSQGQTGRPEIGWISRRLTPILHVYPVPTDSDVFTVEIDAQREPRRLSAKNGEVRVPLPISWRKYLVTALAADIGDGAVRKLEEGRLGRLQRDAAQAESKLLGYSRLEGRRPLTIEAWE